VVSTSKEVRVVQCACPTPACIAKAAISSSDTGRFLVARAVLLRSRCVLVRLQQLGTPESVETAKRRNLHVSGSRGAWLLVT